MFSRLEVLKIVFKIPPTTRRYLQLWKMVVRTGALTILAARPWVPVPILAVRRRVA